jgi:hypothetical protein
MVCEQKMIGYIFNSIGFGITDLLLFAFSILGAIWVLKTWRRGIRSLKVRLLTIGVMLLVLVPFILLGLAFLAVSNNAPAASAIQPGPDQYSGAVNMGASINTASREAEPSFTADGRTIYFNCHNADICVSHLNGTWEEGNWTQPERLGAPISTGYEEVEPMINAAGDKLYFTSNRPAASFKGNPMLSPLVTNAFAVINYLATTKFGISFFDGLGLPDVWVSYKVDGVWLEPQNLNDIPGEPLINTEFADHCLSFSADGNEAFWTSTRPGGFGGNDIWTSRRIDGKWTQPENLGPNVNGPTSEHHSIPTPDGWSLYVTSDRAGGYGGEDIYITTRGGNGKWGPLVNLGPPVNGPGNDRCPVWTPDGKIFLFDSTRAGGHGSRDLWWVYFKDIKGYRPAYASADAIRSSAVR